MTRTELDTEGKTNLRAFLEYCQAYREKREQMSSNSGDIRSIDDINAHFRKRLENTSEEEREKESAALWKALENA